MRPGHILALLTPLLFPQVQAAVIEKRQDESWWTPPSNLVTPLNEVWQHVLSTYSNPLGFKNYGYDQLMATGGKIQICVRWETKTRSVTAAERAAIQAAANKMYNKWIAWLAGWDNFPYTTVPVTVVGYAVSSTSLLQGSTSGLDIYTTTDSDGIPQCDPRCGRFFHQDNNYSSCPGGASRHYDWSLWLTEGMGGGAGGDWGARIGLEYMMSNLNSEDIHILEHELGHHFGLDDFYDWTPTGVTNFIMRAGSSTVITTFDGWMLRDWWRHLRTRYSLPSSTPSSRISSSTRTSSSTRASSTSTTRISSISSTRSTSRTTSTGGSTSGAPLYGQCGGQGWTGPTTCASGTCTYSNPYYSQCVP